MFSSFEFMIATRYLRSKGKKSPNSAFSLKSFISVVSLFSLLGIALGVAALIVVMAVMNGFRTELTNKIVGFDGDISIMSPIGKINDYPETIVKIKSLEQVESAYPIVMKQALLSAQNQNNFVGAGARGMQIKDLKNKKIIADNIISGSLDNFEDDYNIVLGKDLAFNLYASVGSKVKVLSPNSNSSILGKIPRFKTFTVKAIFSAGMSEFDSITAIIPLEAAQRLFQLNGMVNAIEVRSKDLSQSEVTALKIYNALDQKYSVFDWKNKNSAFLNALKTERVAMFVILTLIIIVAVFNIISSLIMLVKDKTSDIAILRTIGATRGSIVRIFFICGASLGIIGTALGCVLGLSFAYNIESIRKGLEKITGTNVFDPVVYYLSALPSEIRLSDIILIASISLGFSFLATIYPSLKAASLDPVEALRYTS